jgi:hypothetical protein
MTKNRETDGSEKQTDGHEKTYKITIKFLLQGVGHQINIFMEAY